MAFIQPTDFNSMNTSVTYPVSRTKGRGPSNPGRNLTVCHTMQVERRTVTITEGEVEPRGK